MTSVIFHGNNKFAEFTHKSEKDFEELAKNNSKMLFGSSTIYIDFKPRIDTKSLGGSIPDGLLFDLKDIDNPEFYLVEFELAKHDFYKHVFPQITRFFAFFRNHKSQNELIEKTFSLTQSDSHLEKEFKHFLKGKEIFKFIKDTIESSQNILLVIDDMKPELSEVMETYTEWSKMVRILVFKEYRFKEDRILTLTPDFEGIEYEELTGIRTGEVAEPYTEEYHLDGVDPKVKDIYQAIRSSMIEFKSGLRFNPQKYYISIVDKRNFAYIKLRKTKVRIVIMLPMDVVRDTIKHHKVQPVSEGVRRFYGGDCCTVNIEENSNIDEVVTVLKSCVSKNP